MNIINLEKVRKQKEKEKEELVTIPIIEWLYEINGEIQFVVSGEKDIPLTWLDQED
ncbi:hypothetical protein BK704_11395 [[Bacillus thuringiensis] serovar konkukian]|nr:hypothetical protein [Bacillus thuringiensis]MED1305173.1 hypothetical protein [Bacillus pacificus]OUB11889.1 hypothetical protein BK704_11395 [[Bacillus thuringiensis] serovar konkukian]